MSNSMGVFNTKNIRHISPLMVWFLRLNPFIKKTRSFDSGYGIETCVYNDCVYVLRELNCNE